MTDWYESFKSLSEGYAEQASWYEEFERLRDEQIEQEPEAEPGYLKVAAKGVARGAEGLAAGVGSTARWLGDIIGSEGVSEAGDITSDYWTKAAQTGWEAPDPRVFGGEFLDNPSIKRAVGIVAEAVPSLAAALVAGTIAGPAAGAASLGLLEGAPQYEEAREAGKDIEEASMYGAASTVGTALLEYLPIAKILGGKGKGALRGAGVGAMTEAPTEAAQTVLQNLIAKVGYDKTRSLTEGLIESIIGGAGAGGGAGFVSGALKQTIDELEEKGVDPEAEIKPVLEETANEFSAFAEHPDGARILEELELEAQRVEKDELTPEEQVALETREPIIEEPVEPVASPVKPPITETPVVEEPQTIQEARQRQRAGRPEEYAEATTPETQPPSQQEGTEGQAEKGIRLRDVEKGRAQPEEVAPVPTGKTEPTPTTYLFGGKKVSSDYFKDDGLFPQEGKIVKAAVRLNDGTIAVGGTHSLALEENGKDTSDLGDGEWDGDLFIDSDGNVLTRDEAVALTGEKGADAKDIVNAPVKEAIPEQPQKPKPSKPKAAKAKQEKTEDTIDLGDVSGIQVTVRQVEEKTDTKGRRYYKQWDAPVDAQQALNDNAEELEAAENLLKCVGG